MSLACLTDDKSVPFTSNERIEELDSEFDEVHSDLFKGRCWPILVGSMQNMSTENKELGHQQGHEQNFDSVLTSDFLVRNNVSDDPRINYDAIYGREKPILWVPTTNKRRSYFKCLQKWRGVVLKKLKDSLIAKLEDCNEETPDEVAEILLAEISDEDLPLVEVGSVFYWSIGYHVNPSGQRKRASIIRFRRLPLWTSGELQEAENKAYKLCSLFGLHEEE